MRISTNELFRQGIGSIQDRQAELARVQQQLATGKRLLAPSDDPAAAVQALKLEDRLSQLEQYRRNAGVATERLGQTEGALDQMGQTLIRVRELTIQAANATQTSQSRAAIANEIRELTEGFVAAANSRDARGEYLFAGNRSATQPFARDATGTVGYLGDGGQRRIALSPDRTIAVTESGWSFMTVPRGNGVFLAEPAEGNTGTAQVTAMTVVDPGAAAEGTFDVRFTAADAYEIVDADGAVVAAGTHAAGSAIEFAGRRIVLEGAPAAGDRFVLQPAGVASVFDTLDSLAARLEQPAEDPAARALLGHDLDMTLRDLDQTLERVAELRTSVGARLGAVDAQSALNEDQSLRLQTSLSGIQDLDYAEAVSTFQLTQAALQAAQQTYVQLSRFSLFDYLR